MVISMSDAILEKIYRFPVKGFPGQGLEKTNLLAGAGIPHDRRYAFTKGVEYKGEWLRAGSLFHNSHVDGLLKSNVEFDATTLKITNTDGGKIQFAIDDPASLGAINSKLHDRMGPFDYIPNIPPPQIIERNQDIANWDYPDAPVSIINIETVRAISNAIGAKLDPVRFRGNLIISGLPAWAEFAWMGKSIRIGDAEIEIHRPIDRCPTPGVNPETGERDVEVTQGIMDHFGHIYCGMYAKVTKSAEIKRSDKIEVIGDRAISKHSEKTPEFAPAYPLWPRLTEITSYQVGENTTQLTLKSATSWPLPKAQPGQRLRLHLGQDQIAVEYISDISSKYYHMDVSDSQTGDPVTALIRNDLKRGQTIIISGPFGRV